MLTKNFQSLLRMKLFLINNSSKKKKKKDSETDKEEMFYLHQQREGQPGICIKNPARRIESEEMPN